MTNEQSVRRSAMLAIVLGVGITGVTTAAAQVGNNMGVLNPNLASVDEMAALPHMNAEIASAIVEHRPHLTMLPLNKMLSQHLSADQREALYGKLFVPINLNTASEEEILLVPGAGRRMAHEFDEYRPYRAIGQFRREIGKYVDAAEVAAYEQFVFVPIDLNSGMFRVFSKKVNDQLQSMRERSRFLVGMISWLGFTSQEVPIDEDKRAHGGTKYTLRNRLELAANYVTSFSTRPLRLATYLGLVTSVFSMLMGILYLIQQLIFGVHVAGWPTLIVTLSMLGGMILFVLGIIGEYLGKMYTELQRRQLYVVNSTMNTENEGQAVVDGYDRSKTLRSLS